MKRLDPKTDLLNHERKELYRKITEAARQKLEYQHAVRKWTFTEISQTTGIPNARLSDIRYFHEKQVPLSKNNLIRLLRSGILTTKEIKEQCNLNDKEAEYVTDLEIHEDEDLIQKLNQLKRQGVNLHAEVDELINKTKK